MYTCLKNSRFAGAGSSRLRVPYRGERADHFVRIAIGIAHGITQRGIRFVITKVASTDRLPLSYLTPAGTTCAGGIPGVQAEDSCCVAACGTCGGSGCSTRGAPSLGAADCCASEIVKSGILCEVAGRAPCVVADGKYQSVLPCLL